MDKCKNCGQEIKFLQKLFSRKCIKCNSTIHFKCSCIVLNNDQYKKDKISYIKPLCESCAEIESNKFGENRYCNTCGADITTSRNQINCDICKKIGHIDCLNDFSSKLDLKWLYPYLHTKTKQNAVCLDCFNELNSKIIDVKHRFNYEWVKGTRYEDIKGYKIIKEFTTVPLK